GEDVSGRRVLLYSEQGLGDTIQFARYADLLKRRGARVLLEVHAPMKALMRTLPFGVETFAQGEALPEFDLHSPLLSLPLVFDTAEPTIPWPGAYLSAEENRLRRWQKRLGEKAQLRVGVVWSGSTAHKNGCNRSIALETLSELFTVPVEWLCLQKEIRPADQAVLPRLERLRQFTEEIGDFADTAALVACCDLVISVDTSVAHLAGAMGKPVWILLPYTPDWRWLLDREDSPWYPTARLFRQSRPGNWDDVFARVAAELSHIAANRPVSSIQQQHPAGRREPIDNSASPVAWQPADLSRLLDQAIFVHQRGRLAEAERLYLNILEVQPDHFDALLLLGVIRHQQGRDAEALGLTGSSLTKNPRSAEALSNYGSVLEQLGRHEEALASYASALAIIPDHADTLNNRGNVLLRLNRFEEALTDYNRALASRPDFPDALNGRGTVLLELKRFEEALTSFDRALAIRPDYPDALNGRGNALLGLNRPDAALLSYDRALAVRPDYAEAVNNRGAALRELKRFEEALASYDRALALRPDYADALNNRGR